MESMLPRSVLGSREKGRSSSPADSEKHDDDVVVPQALQAPCIRDPNDDRAASIHETINHLHGLRLWMVTLLNATMLFLVQTEIFIVTTSLVAIAEELGDFDTASWVLASYFLGYVGSYSPWR